MSLSLEHNVEGKKQIRRIHTVCFHLNTILKTGKTKHHCSETQIRSETLRENSGMKFGIVLIWGGGRYREGRIIG